MRLNRFYEFNIFNFKRLDVFQSGVSFLSEFILICVNKIKPREEMISFGKKHFMFDKVLIWKMWNSYFRKYTLSFFISMNLKK